MRVSQTIIILFLCIFSLSVFPKAKVAKVIILKGKATFTNAKGKKVIVKRNAWIEEGSTVVTKPKSFMKLLMKDKSTIVIGPKSKMQITSFKKNKPGVLTLLDGKIRATVNKSNNGKDKMYINTRSAAMGVRGTDFSVIYNIKNNVSNTITYSGEVRMAPPVALNNSSVNNMLGNFSKMLSSVKAISIKEGQFSAVNPTVSSKPTIATKLSPAQFSILEKNTSFKEKSETEKEKSSTKARTRNIAPPGLNIKKAMTENKEMNNLIGESTIKIVKIEEVAAAPVVDNAPPPEGFSDKATGTMAPPAGGFIDMSTGLYVPPPPGSVFDDNTGVYVPPPTLGSIDPETGNYVNPDGYKLDDSGKFVAEEPPPGAAEKVDDGFKPDGKNFPAPPPPPPMDSVVLTAKDVGENNFNNAENDITGGGGETIFEDQNDYFSPEEMEEVAEVITDQFDNSSESNLGPITNVTFNITIGSDD